jgi:hypothetical protein
MASKLTGKKQKPQPRPRAKAQTAACDAAKKPRRLRGDRTPVLGGGRLPKDLLAE